MDALEILGTASLWAAAIRIASPLIFATLGELISERAGVLNLGIEGIMTVGAFAGWFTVYQGGDLWLGVVVAALAGGAFGLLHAILVVPLGLSQHVTGIGITLFAASLTYYTYRLAFPEVTSPPKIEPFAPWPIPFLSDIPFLGEALFRQTPLTYLAFIAVGLVGWFLYRTPAGLAVRTAGENPAAVEAQGIDVTRVRIASRSSRSTLISLAAPSDSSRRARNAAISCISREFSSAALACSARRRVTIPTSSLIFSSSRSIGSRSTARTAACFAIRFDPLVGKFDAMMVALRVHSW